MSDYNPFEADLDIDEETGEVELPPGYRGRSPRPMGQMPQTRTPTFSPPASTAQQAPSAPPSPNDVPPAPNGSGGAAGPLSPAPCPPCPPCGPGRLVSPGGFPLGLVIGIGLVGTALWWSGKMLADIEEVEDDEPDLDALPKRAPKMLAASNADEEVLEGEVVEDDAEG